MKEINYQFRERLSVVHQPGRRNPEKVLAAGEMEVTDRFSIVLDAAADIVTVNAARDLEDYFYTSMNRSLRVVRVGEIAADAPCIVYRVDESLPEHSYRFAVSENRILPTGSSSRMAAQAGYYLEDLFDKFIIGRTPAERWGTPEDLAGPAVFLASSASDFVNGHILYVDGGIAVYIDKQP